MPVLKNLTVTVVLVAAAAGCGSASSTAGVAAAPTTSRSAAAAASATGASASPSGKVNSGVAWAKCMRAHGINVADPDVSGKGVQLLLPKGADRSKVDAASKACQKYLPGGGTPVKPDPADLAKLRKMAACMRQNGEPKFPDPSADGGIRLDSSSGLNPQDPDFIKAQNTCSKYSPQGGKAPVVQGGK